jgi:hypothetical protein
MTLMGNRIASGWSNNTDAVVDGQKPKNLDDISLRWNNVGPDFFATLNMPASPLDCPWSSPPPAFWRRFFMELHL